MCAVYIVILILALLFLEHSVDHRAQLFFSVKSPDTQSLIRVPFNDHVTSNRNELCSTKFSIKRKRSRSFSVFENNTRGNVMNTSTPFTS